MIEYNFLYLYRIVKLLFSNKILYARTYHRRHAHQPCADGYGFEGVWLLIR